MLDEVAMTDGASPRIVLLSPDMPGPHACTAAGHVALRLAQRLVAEGAVVELLVPRIAGPQWPHAHWWQVSAGHGVGLHILPLEDGADAMLGYRALEWLRRHPAPDLLLAMDSRGLGAGVILARRIGLALQGVPIGVVVSGPDAARGGLSPAASPTRMLRRHLENEAMAGADFLLFADAALREHCAPGDRPCRVLAGLGLGVIDAPTPTPGLRLTEGLADAASARALAALLRDLPDPQPILRMPLPPAGDTGQEDPLAALVAALGGDGPPLALEIGPGPGFAASRFVAGEVLLRPPGGGAAAPLAIDARAAGIAVLPPEAGLLQRALALPAPPAPEAWAPLLPFLRAQVAPKAPVWSIPQPAPLVSVCISHFNRPKLLAQTLDSLRAQTWPAVEVVLVDDASPPGEATAFLASQEADFAARGWRIIRNATEQWQAISRNTAARAARGAFILVMDDDNLARPHEIETMVRALLATGADAVGAHQALFEGDHDALTDERPDRVEFFPTSGPADVGVVWNIYGDVNVMFRREAFEAVGGYTEALELGCEDYEIGAALARDGRRLIIIPEALYLYRFSSVNMAKGMSNERLYWSHRRPLRPALASLRPALDPALARLLAFTHGAEHAQQQGQGWSYWAGRAFHRDRPEYGITGAGAAGDDFLLHVALAAIEAGHGPAARDILLPLAGRGREDARLARALGALALLLPDDAVLRGRLLVADQACGTGFAGDVARALLRRGEAERARDWVEAGLDELAALLPEPGP